MMLKAMRARWKSLTRDCRRFRRRCAMTTCCMLAFIVSLYAHTHLVAKPGEEFVVRPSGGSSYVVLTPDYELPPDGRTTNLFTESETGLVVALQESATAQETAGDKSSK